MQRATDPDRARRLEYPIAFGHPFFREFQILFPTSTPVPIAFVDAYHSAGVTGDAAIRQEIWRICPDAIESVTWK